MLLQYITLNPTPCDQWRLISIKTAIKTTKSNIESGRFASFASIECSRRNDRFVIFVNTVIRTIASLISTRLRLYVHVYNFDMRMYTRQTAISIQRSKIEESTRPHEFFASGTTRFCYELFCKYLSTAVSSRNLFAWKKNKWKIGLVDREKDCPRITISST